jgi:hypothetical protein
MEVDILIKLTKPILVFLVRTISPWRLSFNDEICSQIFPNRNMSYCEIYFSEINTRTFKHIAVVTEVLSIENFNKCLNRIEKSEYKEHKAKVRLPIGSILCQDLNQKQRAGQVMYIFVSDLEELPLNISVSNLRLTAVLSLSNLRFVLSHFLGRLRKLFNV